MTCTLFIRLSLSIIETFKRRSISLQNCKEIKLEKPFVKKLPRHKRWKMFCFYVLHPRIVKFAYITFQKNITFQIKCFLPSNKLDNQVHSMTKTELEKIAKIWDKIRYFNYFKMNFSLCAHSNVCLSVRLSVFLLICLSVCLSVHLSWKNVSTTFQCFSSKDLKDVKDKRQLKAESRFSPYWYSEKRSAKSNRHWSTIFNRIA